MGPIGVLELARRLKIEKSAVSRILTTFRAQEYVRVLPDGRYDLGVRIYELGHVIEERLPFRVSIIPHVDALAAETGETAFAVHHRSGQIAYLYDCVSTQDIRLGERTGRRSLVWNHLAGTAILAQRDEAKVLGELTLARRSDPKIFRRSPKSVVKWHASAIRAMPQSALPISVLLQLRY
jgi:DNA-binding IclR family transcriptional regulator